MLQEIGYAARRYGNINSGDLIAMEGFAIHLKEGARRSPRRPDRR
jgi:hypothetical protein